MEAGCPQRCPQEKALSPKPPPCAACRAAAIHIWRCMRPGPWLINTYTENVLVLVIYINT
jgi:hypothetical protein